MNKTASKLLLALLVLVLAACLGFATCSVGTYAAREAQALSERPEGDGPFVFDRASLRWYDLTLDGRLWRDCVTLDNGYLYYAEWDDPLVPLSEFQGYWEKDGLCILVSAPIRHQYAVSVVNLSGG